MKVGERGNFLVITGEQPVESYNSLSDLVWHFSFLKTLYPDFPKEEAFR